MQSKCGHPLHEGMQEGWGGEKAKPWVNPRSFQVSVRQNLCQASLDVKKKLKYLVLQELIERSHQLFVSINALMRGLFLKLNLVKMLPLDTHPIIHFEHQSDAKYFSETGR